MIFKLVFLPVYYGINRLKTKEYLNNLLKHVIFDVELTYTEYPKNSV